MPYETNSTVVLYEVLSTSQKKITLQIFPLINSRHFHAVTNKDTPGLSFTQKTSSQSTRIRATKPEAALILSSSSGHYRAGDEWWIEDVFFRVDNSHGTNCFDDCYVPGRFEIDSKPNNKMKFHIVAVTDKNVENVEAIHSSVLEKVADFDNFLQVESNRSDNLLRRFSSQNPTVIHEDWLKWLVLATDSFIVNRASTKTRTVIAGYHWFEDWGRDSLISLPGLTLVTGRFVDAKDILLTFENGEPTFHALLFITRRNKDGKQEFTDGDLRKMRKLAEYNNEWWQLQVSNKACWLYYRPYNFYQKHYPDRLEKNDVCFNLGRVAELMSGHIR